MNRDDFERMTVVQLKDFLRKKGARQTAKNKDELVDRAYSYAIRPAPVDDKDSRIALENDYKIILEKRKIFEGTKQWEGLQSLVKSFTNGAHLNVRSYLASLLQSE